MYSTARLSGLPHRRVRLLAAALLGAAYGVLCVLPPFHLMAGPLPRLLMAAGLLLLAFGRREEFLRHLLLFLLISCTMGGLLLAAVRAMAENGGAELLRALNWGVFFLAGGGCWLLLSVVFRGGARHALRGELAEGRVELRGRTAPITALLDTGHTLTDPSTGGSVLVVHWRVLEALWSPEEMAALESLEAAGAVETFERLAGLEPGLWRLLPYQTVGLSGGLLVCLQADKAVIGKAEYLRLTVALSPGPISDGGSCNALWGGMEKDVKCHAV